MTYLVAHGDVSNSGERDWKTGVYNARRMNIW